MSDHFTDPWNGRATLTRCSSARCRSWAVAKYSTRAPIGHGYMTIGFYCKRHIEPVLAAHPEDKKPQPKEPAS